MDIEIRKMELADLKETLNLCNLCFEEETDYESAKEIFLKYQNDFDHIYLVGIVDEKIVAHLKITIVPTIYGPMATYAMLNHVCVHPNFRRHHYGTKMLEVAEKICKDSGAKTIELWSKNFREGAHALYNRYGFVAQDAKYFKKVID